MSIDSKPTKRQVVRADAGARAQRAWAARVAGATWEQVGELVGFSDGTAALRAVRRYFGQLPVIEREETRRLWRERNELLWKQAVRDTSEQRPGAIRAAVAVAQRAAALDGLDAPVRMEVSNPSVEEFNRLVDNFVQQLGGEIEEADVFALEQAESESEA
jgi:hypothetical protein